MKPLGEFFSFHGPDAIQPPNSAMVPAKPEELSHDLVTTKVDATAHATLDLSTQNSGEYPPDIIPGSALGIETSDNLIVEGGVYTLGSTPLFIARKIIALPDAETKRLTSVQERSIIADQRGDWFEHVYPWEENNAENGLRKHLMPLLRHSRESGSFFVVAVVDGSYVVMPATTNKKIHKQGVSERYAQYANLKNASGKLATQAMIYIDPGEATHGAYTDSEQIGVRDADLPYGQMQYDADYDGGWVCDTIKQTFNRGVEIKIAEARASGSVGTDSSEWEYGVDGASQQQLQTITHSTPSSWQLKQR